MHSHSGSMARQVGEGASTVLLVGNPNVGKSVVFGHLTGSYAQVANYPGTTVDFTSGRLRAGEGWVTDLPGTYSLISFSEDEEVTRDVLLSHLGEPGLKVVQVADSKNLRQGLFLTLQLAELELPMVLVANMADEAAAQGVSLDRKFLEETLGVELLESVATRGSGLERLTSSEAVFRRAKVQVPYPGAVEQAIDRLEAVLPGNWPGRRGIVLMLLACDGNYFPWMRERLGEHLPEVEKIRKELVETLEQPAAYLIDQARQEAADRIRSRAVHRNVPRRRRMADRLGGIALHPVWGLPVAALVLYVTYLIVGKIGAGVAVDFLENQVFASLIMPWLDSLLRAILPDALEGFLVGAPGVGVAQGGGVLIGSYGLISMGLSYALAIVLPIVGFFFIVFSTLEDSGYLPRLAVLLNQAFRLVGLNGKAVLPMILGLGCDTMATMTARILPTKKERVIATLLLALGVPCSAQLGVIMGMLGGLSVTAMLIWLGTITGTMLVVGALAQHVVPGERSAFLLEIPPMRVPVLSNIVIKTLARLEWYLKEIVPLFLLGTFVLWVLDRFDALRILERYSAPLVQGWLGLPARATEAFLIGFLRRDYGAAGLYDLFQTQLKTGAVTAETEIQIVVSLVTITLFVPCIANFFMIVKERGLGMALGMAAFIFPLAVLVGGALNFILREVML